jgi:hypothetical protein
MLRNSGDWFIELSPGGKRSVSFDLACIRKSIHACEG